MSLPYEKSLLESAWEALPYDWCHCPIGLVCTEIDYDFLTEYAHGSEDNDEIDEQAALLMGWSPAQVCTFRETFDAECPHPEEDGFTNAAVKDAIAKALAAAKEAP